MTLKSSAFTLIELTLVTVIILVLAGLSLPIFKNTFQDLSAKDAAFNISKLISYAREKAVLDKANYKIIFDFTRRQYQLFESTRSDEGIIYRIARGRFGRAFNLPQNLFFHDAKTDITQELKEEYKKQVVFYPDGHCDELAIDILDKKGKGYAISLKGFGSTARIKEVAGEPR